MCHVSVSELTEQHQQSLERTHTNLELKQIGIKTRGQRQNLITFDSREIESEIHFLIDGSYLVTKGDYFSILCKKLFQIFGTVILKNSFKISCQQIMKFLKNLGQFIYYNFKKRLRFLDILDLA